jgi:folate-dependent phosphoribosylglycinamide formyltransferase PurN
MVALAKHIEADPDLKVANVIAPKAEAPAVEVALNLGLEVAIVPYGEEFESKLLKALEGSDWICLAGFLRLLPESVVDRWNGKILNIHPALLPKFGGKGMYGMHVHEAVIAAGETESGCSVHYVTKEYDEGAVMMQARCPVEPNDTPETLAARVLTLEHETYFKALKVAIDGQRS